MIEKTSGINTESDLDIDWESVELTPNNIEKFCQQGQQFRFILTSDNRVLVGQSDSIYHKDLVADAGISEDEVGRRVLDGGFIEPITDMGQVIILSHSSYLESKGVSKSLQLANRSQTIDIIQKLLPSQMRIVALKS